MTSREGYDAYTLYLGIKLHFYSEDYDFVRYNGKVKADINSFVKRKDKYHFGKLYRTYKQDLQDFYIANLSQKDMWAGDMLDTSADKVYKEWKKRNQKLSYMFRTEVSDLLRKSTITKVLEVKDGQHPKLLKEFMAKKISLETMCILDEIIGFTKDWDRLITEQVVYPEIHIKINKYKAFVSFDHETYKKKLIELCST
jgi:hypothetical protein